MTGAKREVSIHLLSDSELAAAPRQLQFKHVSKKSRAFRVFKSGLDYGQALNWDWLNNVHITLTRSKEVKRDMNDAWQALLKRIKRKYREFEYCKIRVGVGLAEGEEHLHILARCPFIRQKWLSKAWREVYGAKIVWIRRLYGKTADQASYMATNYVARQEGTTRLSYSWKWLWKGASRQWRDMAKEHLEKGGSFGLLIAKWRFKLQNKAEIIQHKYPRISTFFSSKADG